jgi:hypothetical protein
MYFRWLIYKCPFTFPSLHRSTDNKLIHLPFLIRRQCVFERIKAKGVQDGSIIQVTEKFNFRSFCRKSFLQFNQ